MIDNVFVINRETSESSHVVLASDETISRRKLTEHIKDAILNDRNLIITFKDGNQPVDFPMFNSIAATLGIDLYTRNKNQYGESGLYHKFNKSSADDSLSESLVQLLANIDEAMEVKPVKLDETGNILTFQISPDRDVVAVYNKNATDVYRLDHDTQVWYKLVSK